MVLDELWFTNPSPEDGKCHTIRYIDPETGNSEAVARIFGHWGQLNEIAQYIVNLHNHTLLKTLAKPEPVIQLQDEP